MWKHFVHWGRYILKQGNPLHNFKNHSQQPNIIILLSYLGSLSHHFKVYIVDIWLYWSFSGVRGEVLFEKFHPLRQIRPETGESLENFKNHSQIPNIIILLPSLGSLSRHFKVHSIDIWLYCFFSVVRGELLCEKVLDIGAATSWNRVIPC